MKNPIPRPTGAAKSFGIYELLENTLLYLPPSDVPNCRAVCKDWHAVICDSLQLRYPFAHSWLGFENPAADGKVTCRGICYDYRRRGKRCNVSRNLIARPAIKRLQRATRDRRFTGSGLRHVVERELEFICCRYHKSTKAVDEVCNWIEIFRGKEAWKKLPERDRDVAAVVVKTKLEQGEEALLGELKWQGLLWEGLMVEEQQLAARLDTSLGLDHQQALDDKKLELVGGAAKAAGILVDGEETKTTSRDVKAEDGDAASSGAEGVAIIQQRLIDSKLGDRARYD